MVHVRQTVISGERLCRHPMLSLNCVIIKLSHSADCVRLALRTTGCPSHAGCHLPAFAFHPTPAPHSQSLSCTGDTVDLSAEAGSLSGDAVQVLVMPDSLKAT